MGRSIHSVRTKSFERRQTEFGGVSNWRFHAAVKIHIVLLIVASSLSVFCFKYKSMHVFFPVQFPTKIHRKSMENRHIKNKLVYACSCSSSKERQKKHTMSSNISKLSSHCHDKSFILVKNISAHTLTSGPSKYRSLTIINK